MPYALYVCLQDDDKITAFAIDAETGRQSDRGEDPGDVGQSADDGLFLRSHEALFVSGHVHHLLCRSGGRPVQYAARTGGTPRPAPLDRRETRALGRPAPRLACGHDTPD